METQQKQIIIDGLKKHIRKKDYGELEKSVAEATDNCFERLGNLQFKSRTAATLLSIFFGGIGAGRLYLRDYGTARKRILATLIFNLILPIIGGFALIFTQSTIIKAFEYFNDDLVRLFFLGVAYQIIFSMLAVCVISILLTAWQIEEIYNCYYVCSERNLQCIKSCINACYASDRLNILSQNNSIDLDKIKIEQHELCQDKFSVTKKLKPYINEDLQIFPWDLLTASDKPTFENLNKLKLKSKAIVAWLSILLGGVCAGRFYIGNYKMGIIKTAVTLAIYLLSGAAFYIPVPYLGAVLCFLGNAAIFIWYLLEIPKCIKLCTQMNYNRINGCISHSVKRKSV